MGNLLDSPNTAKMSEPFTSSTGLVVGSSGMQGWRLEMEDAHISCDMPSIASHTFVAIFDGHGGAGAANYAATNLITHIEETGQWEQYVRSGAKDPHLLGEALSQAFLDLDAALRVRQSTDNFDSSGCTSVTAMITPGFIVCANAGDSRCVLGTNKASRPMSEDHKPTDDLERRRIESAGGRVQWKRVDGDLAVSRAFGDFQYKTRSDLGPREQKVSCFPDITIQERSPQDEVLLLACDGLWDVMSSDEAIVTIRNIFSEGANSMVLVAEEMLEIALHKGSKDNISAVVVKLPGAVIKEGRFSNEVPDARTSSKKEGGEGKAETKSNKMFGRFATFRTNSGRDLGDDVV